MRQTKFRCWNGKTMVSPDYVDREGVAHWKENSIPQSTDRVMLWTGLLDKLGKEIYEGDIIDWQEGGDTARYEIKFSSAMFWCRNPEDAEYNTTLAFLNTELAVTVIGNIYEDKDLLEANV